MTDEQKLIAMRFLPFFYQHLNSLTLFFGSLGNLFDVVAPYREENYCYW